MTTLGNDGLKKPALPGPTIVFVQHVALQLQAMTDRATVDAVISRVGMPHPFQVNEDIVIDLLQEAAFVDEAAAASGNIDFGFLAGLSLSMATSLPGYISEHARTLRDALVDASRFVRHVRPGMDFTLEELGNVATLQLKLSDPRLHDFPRHREAVFSGVIGQIRSFTGRPFYPELLQFRHDRIPLGSEARTGLGCGVRFGAETTEMLMATGALDRPIRGRDDALRALLVSHGELLEGHAERHQASFAERVELFIQHSLPEEVPTADITARELGVSRRTLSRRLMEAGTSFADILSHVRLRVAAGELRSTDRSISAIGWRLGFASPSAFSAAFRKATGLTPRQYRSGMVIDDKAPE